jgi:sulfur-oxidizing protein SoxX
MLKKHPIATALSAATTLFMLTAGCSTTHAEKAVAPKAEPVKVAAATPAPAAAPAKVDYTTMSPAALAEYLVMESGSFDLKQPTQEGTTGRDRLTQDEIQKACSLVKGKELDDKTREKVMALAAASIKYPEGGIKLGDWKKGRELAWSGYGYRTAHKPDDHGTGTPGGNCYNCHQIATDRTGGNIGPELTGFGKLRGSDPDTIKYAYDVIYNPHVYFACTSMPRMGANGVISQAQIADILAYLFDPASPVNK